MRLPRRSCPSSSARTDSRCATSPRCPRWGRRTTARSRSGASSRSFPPTRRPRPPRAAWRWKVLAPPALLEPRIERVAQAVAEEVEAQHGDEDGKAGKERQPGGGLDERDVGLQIPPPARRRRLRTQPEEGQRGLDDDRGRDAEGGGHDDRRQTVG